MAAPLRRLGLALAFAALPMSTASARDVTAGEIAALEQVMADFDAAMRAGEYPAIVEIAMPPRVLEFIAGQAKITTDELREGVAVQFEQLEQQVQITSFGMDLDGARHEELADGTPYVMIPTTTVMSVTDGGNVKAVSETLALMDEGTWYLVRVSEPAQVELLRQVYPEFAGVEFSPATMEDVE